MYTSTNAMKIAVVIPCYNVKNSISSVINGIGSEVVAIYAVDDCCPENTADYLEETCSDSRLTIIRHDHNKGVGGAVMTGYRRALDDNMDVIVKVDGDGQMDPSLIENLTKQIVNLEADYVKGNRFYSIYNVRTMPKGRMFGNAILGFITKISSGYWSIFDPTNGFTAISATAARLLNFKNISERYFFETDLLVNLGGVRAVVRDYPMEAIYGDEVSGLKISRILPEFMGKHIKAILKRVFYQYFLRNFSIGSLNLFLGLILVGFGVIYGSIEWYSSVHTGNIASSGTVMIAVLPIIIGFQMLIAFLAEDIANEPTVPLTRMTRRVFRNGND